MRKALHVFTTALIVAFIALVGLYLAHEVVTILVSAQSTIEAGLQNLR